MNNNLVMNENTQERSNFKDLMSASSSKKQGGVMIGDGLFVATQQKSNLSNEMANLEA